MRAEEDIDGLKSSSRQVSETDAKHNTICNNFKSIPEV